MRSAEKKKQGREDREEKNGEEKEENCKGEGCCDLWMMQLTHDLDATPVG